MTTLFMERNPSSAKNRTLIDSWYNKDHYASFTIPIL